MSFKLICSFSHHSIPHFNSFKETINISAWKLSYFKALELQINFPPLAGDKIIPLDVTRWTYIKQLTHDIALNLRNKFKSILNMKCGMHIYHALKFAYTCVTMWDKKSCGICRSRYYSSKMFLLNPRNPKTLKSMCARFYRFLWES